MKSQEIIKSAISFDCKETAPCARQINFTVTAEGVAAAYTDAAKNAMKYAKLPGFRAGKAPISMVKARYAEYIQEDVERQLQQIGFATFSEKTSGKMDVIAFGRMNAAAKPEEAKEYAFDITVEVAPAVEVPDFNAFEKPEIVVDDIEKRIADRLAYMKQIYAEYAPLDGEVQDGDMLKVSYESDYALPENAAPALARAVKADESWLHIIEPEQIPGMNAALKGGVKGGEYTFTAEFPADWRQEELRGAKVNYKVKINDGQRKVELKDDQALADKMKIESVEKMMENFRTMAENELKGETAEKKQSKLLETLLEKTPAFTLPESMVAEVTQREFNRLINQLVRSQEDVEEFKKNQEQHLADAKKAAEDYVRKFFIVRTIAKAEGIEVSKEELDAQIRMMCMYTGRKEEEVRKQLEQGNGLSEINEDLLIGKTLHTVAEKIWA